MDEVFTNVYDRAVEKLIQKPLSKLDGTPSDHSIIAASFKLPKQKKSVATKFSFRPITKKGMNEFKSLLIEYDWNQIEKTTRLNLHWHSMMYCSLLWLSVSLLSIEQ